jgi:hypothetical protein
MLALAVPVVVVAALLVAVRRAALLVAVLQVVRLVVLPVVVLRVLRLVLLLAAVVLRVLLEVVPRVLPVERLRSPSFSAVTARTTR